MLYNEFAAAFEDTQSYLESQILFDEFSGMYEEIEEKIQVLTDAIARFDGVIDGFVRVLQTGEGSKEWNEVVERDIGILMDGMGR